MKPEPYREGRLFQAAAELTGSDRTRFLDRECGDDVTLRQRLEVLLAAHETADSFMTDRTEEVGPGVGQQSPETPDEAVGQTIGRYKLLEKIGEGGCGVVYVAEQTEPIRRRVALKVIKLGMDTKQVVARFERERQALAMMDHPSIARVLDAGAAETGRPYFVMELVRGIRITEYCERNNLPTAERLDLFAKVCHAIQHAHQKGIIHRDIKPSNILVTLHDGELVPKVIDFGIAKATEGRLTNSTVYTQLHQFIGTPAYMSPEQAEMSGLDVDTRSDIYSLGVLLYELLTDKTPFDAQELIASGLDAMRRTIREKEPLRPSTRLATLPGEELTLAAKRRGAEGPKLVHLLRGDLDWIVMKCLEKDRTRRYETASALAMDIRHFTSNEPVSAVPPSAGYKLQKFFRRNRTTVLAAAAISVLLIGGLTTSTWLAVKFNEAKKSVERERSRAVQAEKETQEKLRESYLARSILNRATRGAGIRAENVQMLKDAARFRPGTDLRNEAVATLALPERRLLLPPIQTDPRWCVNPDLQFYAARKGDTEVIVRDIMTQREIAHFPSTGRRATQLRFSPNNEFLAIHYEEIPPGSPYIDDLVHVWPWNDAAAKPFPSISYSNNSDFVEFTPDSRWLVLGRKDGALLFYEPRTGRMGKRLQVKPGLRSDVVFSPRGDRLAQWQYGTIIIYSMSDGQAVGLPLRQQADITDVAWHPNGKLLASTSLHQIHLWDVDTGRLLATGEAHEDTAFEVEFNHSGTILASLSRDLTTRFWSADDCRLILTSPGGGTRLQFSRDDRKFSHARYGDEALVLSEIVASPVFSVVQTDHSGASPNDEAAVNPQGNIFACLSGELQLREVERGLQLAAIPYSGNRHFCRSDTTGDIYLNGYAGYQGLVRWPVRTSANATEFRFGPPEGIGTPRPYQAMHVSGDGTRIAAICQNHSHIFDAATRLELAQTGYQSFMHFLALSPNGDTLATGSFQEKGVRIWESRTGLLERELPTDGGCQVIFSPDGSWLLAATRTECQLWQTASWTPQWVQSRHKRLAALNQISFSPDSRLLALAGPKSTVDLVDVKTGEEVARLDAPDPAPISWLGFNPNGGELIVMTVKASLHRWNLPRLREGLAAIGLDWPVQGLSRRAQVAPAATRVTVNSAEPEPAPFRSIDAKPTIPPRDPRSTERQVDLSDHYNAAFVDEWHVPGFTNGFSCIRPGLINLGGVIFDARGVIRLAGLRLDQAGGTIPQAVREIRVAHRCRRLQFLHGTSGPALQGAMIGNYVIRYADGRSEEVPIRYGEELRSWWSRDDPIPELKNGSLAWTGTNTVGMAVRLWKSSWDIGRPEVEIATLGFVSNLAKTDPFLIAITTE